MFATSGYLHKVVYTIDRMADRALLEGAGITASQFLVLRSLDTDTELAISQQAIADYLGIHKAAISRHVSALVQRGLVRRRTPVTSRRQYSLHLTAAGHATLRQGRAIVLDVLAPHFEAAGPQLLDSLQAMHASLERIPPPKSSAAE
jgi:DNA-binding MarR family transcriptional regulator